MFILRNFFLAFAQLLDIVLTLYMYIVIARAVISWVNPDPYNPIVRFLYSITEPLMNAVRRRLPLFYGGIDFSPMLILLAIIFLQSFLVSTLRQIAAAM